MNYPKIFFTCLLILMIPATLLAQLSLDGELRPRTEYRNGYGALQPEEAGSAFFTSQRTRLSMLYRTDLYNIKVTGQDIRVWGDEEQLRDIANVNIHEAWAELKISEKLDAKLGRQELVYDDHRLLGNVNWTQPARSHDALVFRYHNTDTGFSADAGGAFNQETERLFDTPYLLDNYKVLSYIWLHKKAGPLQISLTGLTDGFQRDQSTTVFRYTYGSHLVYNAGDLQITGTVYVQSGDDAARDNISAHMYAVKTSYTLSNLRLSAGYDYLSGGSSRNSNPERRAFNTLYATNHKFYGHMDHFLNIPSDTRSGGLQDRYLQANYKINGHADIMATYHYFSLAGNIAAPDDPVTALEKSLGSEMDFGFAYTFTPEITLQAGYSFLIPSASLERIQQVDAGAPQQWGWVMLSLTPELLK